MLTEAEVKGGFHFVKKIHNLDTYTVICYVIPIMNVANIR